MLRSLAILAVLISCPACYSFNRVNINPFGQTAGGALEEKVLFADGGPGGCFTGAAPPRAKILLIPIQGVIAEGLRPGRGTTPGTIRQTLKLAAKDKSIRAVILKIDSPGGTVSASDLVYRMVMRYAKKQRIPVYAHIESVGASGAYYVAMTAGRINAVPTAMVGSIGVIMRGFNAKGLLAKIGVKERTIVSGKNKDTGSPFRDLRPDEREHLQKQVTLMYERFVKIVLTGRRGRLTRANLGEVADGRVMSATQAQEAKLIDSVSYIEEFLASIKKEKGFRRIAVVAYLSNPGRVKNLYDVTPARTRPLQAVLRTLTTRGLLYLWEAGL